VTDVVDTAAEARTLERPPLLVLDAVRAFLDAHGLGSGGLAVARTGEGRSNFTFVVERDGGERFVLRRPPRPPYPPSAHDMVREARLQLALAELGIRVPRVVAVCEDESVLGVPFYVMDFVAGDVVTTELPAPTRRRGGGSATTSSTCSPRSTPPTSTRPGWRRSGAGATTSSGSCAASRSSGRATRPGRSRRSTRSARGSRRRSRPRCRRPSSTATSGSGT
jgi:hypothetical protein